MNASCHLNPNKGIWAGQQALSRGLYTNVTESSCFSVFTDKLFKVLGMSVIVPSSTLPPLFPILCLLLFHEQCHNYKSARMQSIFCDVHVASFLSPECYAVGRHVGDFIVEKTKQNYGTEQLLMVTRYSSLLFIALLFWSSPLSLPSFTFPFIHCHCLLSFLSFSFSMCGHLGILQWLIQKWKEKGIQSPKRTRNMYASSMQPPSCFLLSWEKHL